jgi:hypothetical protein
MSLARERVTNDHPNRERAKEGTGMLPTGSFFNFFSLYFQNSKWRRVKVQLLRIYICRIRKWLGRILQVFGLDTKKPPASRSALAKGALPRADTGERRVE